MTATAFVTGATGGIGAAIARRLADDGYRVSVGYRRAADTAARIVDDLAGDGHHAVRIDVTDAESVATATQDIDRHFGHLDALVNCAGITEAVPHDDLDGLDDALIDRIFATNWRGAFATIRSCRELLSRSHSPTIVNISSVSAITGQGSNIAYCASKAALDSMTRSLARALAPTVRVVSVSPGWVLGEYADRMPTDVIDTQTRQTPLGRLATPDDVGAAVCAVLNHLTFTTGVAIAVDGGRPLGIT